MQRFLSFAVVFLLAFGMLATSFQGIPTITARAETILLELTSTPADNYGYTAAPVALVWVDIAASGNLVDEADFYPNADDAYVGAFPMGFYFPYYENTYTELRISTNGYLTLDLNASEQLIRNLDLPSDQKPNNIIAPFWDDLIKGSGNLYYANGNRDGLDYFAVQWDAFSRFNQASSLTFQVLLFENGDMLFQYKEMNATLSEASVGIEDGDGVDGISYLFNGVGIPVASNSAIRFTRPGQSYRAKLTPLYSGGFVVSGQATFDVTLTNTGNVLPTQSDAYILSSSILDGSIAGWNVDYLLDNQLVSTTGLLPQKESQIYQVIVTPPEAATVGDHALIELKATSTLDESKSATVKIQVAVPTKFMHAYADSTGMHLGRYWKENLASTNFPLFDQNVALVPAGDNYVMVWDLQEGEATNLSYVVINRLGIPDSYVSRLEWNILTNDPFPSLAGGMGDNHQVAVVWPRYTLNNDLDEVYNLMLAVLNPDLDQRLVMPEVNLTDNNEAYTTSGGVKMGDVHACWVNEQAIWLIWTEQRFIDSQEDTTDIRAGLFDLNTQDWVVDPMTLAEGTKSVFYSNPTLLRLEDSTVLAFFSGENPELKTQQIYWAVLAPNGTVARGQTALGTMQGGSLDAAILVDKVILAGVTPDRGAVFYSLITLSGSGPSLSLDPDVRPLLVLENLNLVENISIFADQQNHGILTWKNVDHTQMVYALVDQDGSLLTPAVMFYRDPTAGIRVSKNGQSSAVYTGAYPLLLPLIRK